MIYPSILIDKEMYIQKSNLNAKNIPTLMKRDDILYNSIVGVNISYLLFRSSQDKFIWDVSNHIFDLDIMPLMGNLIKSIDTLFNKFLSNKDIDCIKDSALLLEGTDNHLALELMKICLRMRPKGQFIFDKIRKYEKDKITMKTNSIIIHAYVMCYNEARILPYTIKHYKQFCDKIFIIDNDSSDKSVDIAKSFENVYIIPFPTEGFDDLDNVFAKETFYKEYSRKDGSNFCGQVADFIITADADEHIYHPNIKNILYQYKLNNITVPQICGFNMTSNTFPIEDKLLYQIVKQGFKDKVFDKPIVFANHFNMLFSPGCHPSGKKYNQMLADRIYKTSENKELSLLHFKHLGDNFLIRAKVNKSRLSERNIEMGFGKHYSGSDSELENRTLRLNKASYNIFDDEGNVLMDKYKNICFDEISKILNNGFEVADVLREIAICFERSNDIKTAEMIMQQALKLRPNGPIIKEKINQYKQKLDNLFFENFIMIVTYQRSGSTLLQSILNSVDNCTIRGENMNSLFHIFKSYKAIKNSMQHQGGSEEKDWPFFGIKEAKAEEFFYNSIHNFINNILNINDKNIGFKEVKYTEFGDDLPEFLDLMKKCIPNLKIIFNYRNLDDVVVSAWNKNKNKNDLKNILFNFENLCNNYHNLNPNWTRTIRYDDYINDSLKISPIFEFLGFEANLNKVNSILEKKLMHGK